MTQRGRRGNGRETHRYILLSSLRHLSDLSSSGLDGYSVRREAVGLIFRFRHRGVMMVTHKAERGGERGGWESD